MARTYVRKFDHDEAAARHAAGETLAALASEYGVTPQGVERAIAHLDPTKWAASLEYSRQWRTGTCEVCNGPAMRLVGTQRIEKNPDGRTLCAKCRGIEKRERLRFDNAGVLRSVRCSALDCANGERWQPPENFGRGTKFRDVRDGGFHTHCRACLTRDRQNYRNRHKVPCATCGAPALPPSEKRTNGAPFPRCLTCYRATLKASA